MTIDNSSLKQQQKRGDVNDPVFGFYVFSWQVTVALEVSA